MPVSHNRPLPEGHPFKGGCILFGVKPPKAWIERQAAKKLAAQPNQPDDLKMESDKDSESDKEVISPPIRRNRSKVPSSCPCC
jgi:hypothetical protein